MSKNEKRVTKDNRSINLEPHYIDLIVSSNKLKKLFLDLCEKHGYNPYIICMKKGIPAADFRKYYLETSTPRCTKFFNQEDLLRLFKYVGLEINVIAKIGNPEKK